MRVFSWLVCLWLSLGLAVAAPAPGRLRSCRLAIVLKAPGKNPAPEGLAGRLAVRMPATRPGAAKPVQRSRADYRRIYDASTPGWGVGRRHATAAWVYLRGRTLQDAVAEQRPVFLQCPWPGKHCIDFLPTLTPDAHVVWVLPKPFEFELEDDTRVTLELVRVRPFRLEVAVRVPEGAQRGVAARSIMRRDVTAGTPHAGWRSRKTNENGRASFLACPKRRYELRTGLGLGYLETTTKPFAADDYAKRAYDWFLAKASLATWRIELVVARGERRTPFRDEAHVEIRGARAGTNWIERDGVERISVFRDVPEHMSHFVEGHRYAISLGLPTRRDYYITSATEFEVPRGLRGERKFPLVLARKPELVFQCTDAATKRPMPSYRLSLHPSLSDGTGGPVIHPPPQYYRPPKRKPGTYTVQADLKGYRRVSQAITVRATPLKQAFPLTFEPLSQLKIAVKYPDGYQGGCTVLASYADRHEPMHMRRVALMANGETGSIDHDPGRARFLHVVPDGLAPALVGVPKGHKEITVTVGKGVLLDVEIRVGDRPFAGLNPGNLYVISRALGPVLPYQQAMLPADGKVSLRLLPGRYSVYFHARGGWKHTYHLEDIAVSADTRRAYHFTSFEELEPRKMTDDFEPLRKE